MDIDDNMPLPERVREATKELRRKSQKWYPTRLEKIFMYAMGGFFVIAIAFATASRYFERDLYITSAYLCVLLSQISAIAFQIYSTAIVFKDLRDPSVFMLSAIIEDIPVEDEHLRKLRRYQPEDISLMADRIDLGIRHVRSRIGMFIGAFENIGIVPAGVATAAGLFKLTETVHIIDRSTLMWACIALSALYFIGLVGVVSCHRLERISLLLRHAERFATRRNEKRWKPLSSS